jgi:hypothetical protein
LVPSQRRKTIVSTLPGTRRPSPGGVFIGFGFRKPPEKNYRLSVAH